MKYKFIFLFFSLFILSSYCPQKDSFEGIITYKTEIYFKKESVQYKEYFNQKFGDTLVVHFSKNGDILKRFLNAGKRGYDFNAYLNSDNNYYAKYKNLDTLYHYNVSSNAINFLKKTTGISQKILDKQCNYIRIEAIDPIGKQKVIQTFHYNGFPFIDADLFKNYKDFFVHDFFKESNSPFMKMELDLGDYIVTHTAIKIERKKLESGVFELPKGIPKKEF